MIKRLRHYLPAQFNRREGTNRYVLVDYCSPSRCARGGGKTSVCVCVCVLSTNLSRRERKLRLERVSVLFTTRIRGGGIVIVYIYSSSNSSCFRIMLLLYYNDTFVQLWLIPAKNIYICIDWRVRVCVYICVYAISSVHLYIHIAT